MCQQYQDRCTELEAQLAEAHQIILAKDTLLAQKDQQHEQDIQEIQRLRKLIEIKDSITFNKGMTYPERNLMQGIVAHHPDQVLNGEKFEIEVWKECAAAGPGKTSSSQMFTTLNALGAIDYTVTTSKGKDGKYESKSAMAIDLNAIAKVNTKDAPKREENRETKRQRRLERANHPVCPGCGSADHVQSLITPVCTKCEIRIDDQRQLEKPENVFIQTEETPVSDEKSDPIKSAPIEEPIESPTTTDIHEPDDIRAAYEYDHIPDEPDDIREASEPPVCKPVQKPVSRITVSAKVKGWYQDYKNEKGVIGLIDGKPIFELPSGLSKERKMYHEHFISMYHSEVVSLLSDIEQRKEYA